MFSGVVYVLVGMVGMAFRMNVIFGSKVGGVRSFGSPSVRSIMVELGGPFTADSCLTIGRSPFSGERLVDGI